MLVFGVGYEQIAFYNGGPRELELLSDVFEGLANHLSSVFTKEGWYGTLEEVCESPTEGNLILILLCMIRAVRV